MIIQSLPNRWSCMPCSFATATGIPVQRIIDAVGHDGSSIIFPDLEEPLCRRGFLGGEIVTAMLELGYIVATYEYTPFGIVTPQHHFSVNYEGDRLEFFKRICQDSDGVLAGTTKSTRVKHAVAYEGSSHKIYDPLGFIYPFDRIVPEIYYRLVEL